MAYRNRNKKRSQKSRVRGVDSAPPPLNKSQSAPQGAQRNEWPGEIEDKYIEDVRNRLNVIEQTAVTDDMIRAFLAANQMESRHAVVALKKCVEWRKGRQMFWNNYRSQNERFQFLTQIRKVGRGHASTFGHTKSGRLLFYEKIGENFNMSLYKEFTQSEFIDHIIVWCENLSNYALANAGSATHLIHEIPFYEGDEAEAKNHDANNIQGRPPITPQFDQLNQLDLHPKEDDDDEDDEEDEQDEEQGGAFPDITEMRGGAAGQSNSSNDTAASMYKYKVKFRKYEIKSASNACKYSDVVGILDWKGLDVDQFIANKELILAAEHVISTYYPHLINCMYHINMPLNFEKVESEFKTLVSTQSLLKSVFLESEETRIKRMDYMRKYGKKSLKRSMDSRRSLRAGRGRKGKKKKEEKEQKDPDEPPTDLPELDEIAKKTLLEEVPSRFLCKEYGGDIESSQIYTFVDSIYRDLVGVSAEPDPDGYQDLYDEFMHEDDEELKAWKKIPLRSLERHTERVAVKRGEHFTWEYTAEYDRKLIFGATFEAEGFRGKAIKIIVREESEQTVGYCPMFGDFIVLKDGNLVFQFRNIKGGKRLILQYKIQKEVFPQWFVNKHLPDYHAEERLLQSNTLNVGGKKGRYASSSHRSKSNKSPSEFSGSTALSTSPPPDLQSLRVRSENDEDRVLNGSTSHKNLNVKRKSKSSAGKRSKTPQPPQTPTGDDQSYPNKKKRSVKQKKKSVKKKASMKRSRTPNPPHTPNDD